MASGRLADDLWEDDLRRRSVPTLRTYVAKLRHLLPGGDAILASGSGGYRLAIGEGALDAARFERAVQAATGSPGDVERVLLPALAEWRGGAYEEFAHLGWARHEALRLEELRLAAQERVFEAQLALGRHAEIVPALGALASAHPLREGLQIQLVTALYRSGRQAEALAVQRRATAALVDDLGLDPSAELAGLERRILHHDPTLAGPPVGPAPVRAHPFAARLPSPLQRRRPDPTFVGRSGELARLDAALAAAGTDGARLVVVRGEPGIGKTRLAAELGDRVLRRGATVLYGRCDEGVGLPYQPFVAALRELASRAPRDMLAAWLGDDAGALAALVPDLAGHLPGRAAAGEVADPAWQRLRLFDAVAGWLRAVAAIGPTVVVLEDVHWATSSTVMLTRHAVRALADRPVLVLATARSTAPDASALVAGLVADLHRDGRADVIDLEGLDDEALGALVAAEQGTPPPLALVSRLRAATAGNPFLLTRLARYGALDGGVVPASLRDVVLARIERLSAPVRDAVRVGAVPASSSTWASSPPRWTGTTTTPSPPSTTRSPPGCCTRSTGREAGTGSSTAWCRWRWRRARVPPAGRPCTRRWREHGGPGRAGRRDRPPVAWRRARPRAVGGRVEQARRRPGAGPAGLRRGRPAPGHRPGPGGGPGCPVAIGRAARPGDCAGPDGRRRRGARRAPGGRGPGPGHR